MKNDLNIKSRVTAAFLTAVIAIITAALLPVQPAFADTGRTFDVYSCDAKGYRLELPRGSSVTSPCGGYDIKADCGNMIIEVTKEWSPYSEPTEQMTSELAALLPDFKWTDGKDQYIGYYQSRFILDSRWQKNNGVTVSPVSTFNAGKNTGIMYHAVIAGTPKDKYDGFSYAYIRLNSGFFLRIVAKYKTGDPTIKDVFTHIAGSVSETKASEAAKESFADKTVYKPERTFAFSAETAELYEIIEESDTISWGIYTDDIYRTGIDTRIPDLEEKLSHSFDVVLAYRHFSMDFPLEFMNKTYDQNKLVELTYQLTENNNTDMYADSVFMRLYRNDPAALARIREFAKAAKEFGHPFLFRLCNEMNSDWTSYGGVINMGDPDIFVSNWITIYNIFKEEGVNNCIWVFNPNDRNAPPSNWNQAINYYPGSQYVDMIGITGYNNGTYYPEWGDEWREFKEIYNAIEEEYGSMFGSFPWIITEFSSSSVGGDKAAWIDKMFDTIGRYSNIKIAVWFNSCDYDSKGNVSRPYWLDETEDTLKAFKAGINGSQNFGDLDDYEWAEPAITEVTDKGYFNGVSRLKFDPSGNMTRAMFLTVLARTEQVDTAGGEEWYSKAIKWAREEGISDGSAPASDITRGQLAVMLYRLEGLAENDEVNQALKWAVDAGILKGMPDGQLHEDDTATRAQVAVILTRYLDNKHEI